MCHTRERMCCLVIQMVRWKQITPFTLSAHSKYSKDAAVAPSLLWIKWFPNIHVFQCGQGLEMSPSTDVWQRFSVAWEQKMEKSIGNGKYPSLVTITWSRVWGFVFFFFNWHPSSPFLVLQAKDLKIEVCAAIFRNLLCCYYSFVNWSIVGIAGDWQCFLLPVVS